MNEQETTDTVAVVKTGEREAGMTLSGAFGSIANFEAVQRMAQTFATSDLVPDTYKGKIGNCVIAMEMAHRLGANVISVMQNMYLVHGKPAWSSQFLVSCINGSGKFSPLRYLKTGALNSDERTCIAWAIDKAGERLESPPVSIAMAKAEGWYTKNGSKWKTMPELMLMYRAATLFARLYAPELTMGMTSDDEIIDIAPVVTDPPLATDMGATRTETLAAKLKPRPAPVAEPVAPPVEQKAAPTPPPAKSAPDGNVVEGVVEEVSIKDGKTDGKKWTKYGIKIDGEYYGTFSADLGNDAGELEGAKVRLTWKQDGKYKTALAIHAIPDEPAQDTPGNTDSAPREQEEDLPFNK